jgi:hypothetical protein
MFTTSSVRLALLLGVACASCGGQPRESEAPRIVELAAESPSVAPEKDMNWQPSWPGTQVAVLQGNPAGKGPFVFRFRMPDGYWTHPHSHPVAARVRVVSGTYLVGKGSVLDAAAAQTYPAGSEITLEAGRIHFDGAKGETVVEVSGEGPWGATFVDPARDPAR